MKPQELIAALRLALNKAFPERQDAIDCALLAMLTGENVLLLGPPGTAKSMLTRVIAKAFGGRYFERLLTKFSTPEELFGPVSIKGLEQDKFQRVITNKLPEAQFAFVDEVFKANSAILNSLLTMMNEHLYHNDGQVLRCPLVTLFGASNELPEGKELEAMFDRFLFRHEVKYVVKAQSFRKLMTGGDPALNFDADFTPVSMNELEACQREVRKVDVPDAVIDVMLTLRHELLGAGIIVSDRRWRKFYNVIQASAFMLGESTAVPEDLTALVDCMWREPKERSVVSGIIGKVADPVTAKAFEIIDQARECARELDNFPKTDRKAYISKGSSVLSTFQAQVEELDRLSKGAGPRGKKSSDEACKEIALMHKELSASFNEGLKLRR